VLSPILSLVNFLPDQNSTPQSISIEQLRALQNEISSHWEIEGTEDYQTLLDRLVRIRTRQLLSEGAYLRQLSQLEGRLERSRRSLLEILNGA